MRRTRGPHEIAGLHPPRSAGGARGCGFRGVGRRPQRPGRRGGSGRGGPPPLAQMSQLVGVQQAPAEALHAGELAFLEAWDGGERPRGWRLTPRAAVTFVAGSGAEQLRLARKSGDGLPRSLTIPAKFVGNRALVERAVVTLAGERGLMLVGEPGTAKSMLSELLAAAISGTGSLTVQGPAGH